MVHVGQNTVSVKPDLIPEHESLASINHDI
jgi:hypothetical protein